MKKLFSALIVVMLLFSACSMNAVVPGDVETSPIATTIGVTATEFTRVQSTFPQLIPEKDSDNIKVKQFTQGDIIISYPEIKNAKSIVNKAIMQAATWRLDPRFFPLPEHDVALFVYNSDCEVKYLNSEYASVVFWGTYYHKDREDRMDGRMFEAFHAITITLATGKVLEISDVVEINDEFISIVKDEAKKYSTTEYYEEFFEGNEVKKSVRSLIFYLTESGLVIRSLLWYNDGFISEIPYGKLGDLIKVKIG